ncbi:hypothetical protein AYI69_g2486 [Smittium culicis]|uniref:Uncharacterized protein n=1 Tax=Smittium culicis TaxID=133412 RepID=A0A1R1YMT1_9FUNG|nr:hypothetical protein AYI69_g2486 [Smittium culicis]
MSDYEEMNQAKGEFQAKYEKLTAKGHELELMRKEMQIQYNLIRKEKDELLKKNVENEEKIRYSEFRAELLSKEVEMYKEKRAMVTASLTGEARMWYDSEPDENLKNWETYRASLKRQFEGTKNIGNAIYILDNTKLELSFLYSEFILRVRPAIGMISGGNKNISIALLRKCLSSEISRHLPEIFETRVRSQH